MILGMENQFDIRFDLVADAARKAGIKNANQLRERSGVAYELCFKLFKAPETINSINSEIIVRLCNAIGVAPGKLFFFTNGKAKVKA